jgi:glucuronate isomerase
MIRSPEWLSDPAHRPRALFDRFGIEVLATTDPALSDLSHHDDDRVLRLAGPGHPHLPARRPDQSHASRTGFGDAKLAEMTGTDVGSFEGFPRRDPRAPCRLPRARRHRDRSRRADLRTGWLPRLGDRGAAPKAMTGASGEDAARYHGHMLIEMAQMSAEDGMVMQIHAGSTRSTNRALADRFGPTWAPTSRAR